MKQMIKFEVKRMLRNPGFYIAMMIGLIVSAAHWIVEVLPVVRRMDKYMSLDFALLYPPNLYNSWICEGNNMYSYLYLLILPILVTLPYAATFFSDVNDHLIEFICTRADKREYFYAKFTAVFLSGGIVSCVPLIFNILLCTAVVPTIKPQAADSTSNMVPKRKLFCIAVYAPGSLCCDFIDGYIFIQRGTGGICIKCCILLQSHFYGAVSAIGIKRVFIGIVPTAQFAVMGAV